MKTRVNTKTVRRLITSLAILTMICAGSFAQGLLVEGAAKILKNLKKSEQPSELTIQFADYNNYEQQNKRSFHLAGMLSEIKAANEFNRREEKIETVILESLKVSNVEIAFEKELNSEQWMSTPFSENLETTVAVEAWMTESFAESFDADLETETWMTESFADSFEADLETEAWMTEAFAGSFEAEIETESWMTESFTGSFETEIETESWMTSPFIAELEPVIETEDWMTQSFR